MNMIQSAKDQIAALTRSAYRAAVQEGLLPDGDGIGPVGFPLGSRTDGNSVQPNGPGAAPDGQRPFSLCVGIIAQGRSPHGSVSIGSGPYRQGIQSHSAVIEVILVPVAIFRLHTEIMDGSRRRIRCLDRFCCQHRSAPSKSQSAKQQQGQDG